MAVLATASVQSVPRVLLGFGLLGLIAYVILLVAPAFRMAGLVGVNSDGPGTRFGASHRHRRVRVGWHLQRRVVGSRISCAYSAIVLATYAGMRPAATGSEGALL